MPQYDLLANFNTVSYQVLTSVWYGKNSISSLTHSSSWKERKYTTFEWHFSVYVLCVDGVFAIINHWLLHQAVKRLNKMKAICFTVTYVPLCCAMLFFFPSSSSFPFSLTSCAIPPFLHTQTPVQEISTHERHHHYHLRFMTNVTRITCASFHLN